MPNWKKVIVSGSDASLNSLNVTAGVTGSLLGTSSFASTASFINPLNQNALITGSLTVSSSNATQFLVGSNLVFVSSSGNVGIGTTSPTHLLDVNGLARVQKDGAGGYAFTAQKNISGSTGTYNSTTANTLTVTSTGTTGYQSAALSNNLVVNQNAGLNYLFGHEWSAMTNNLSIQSYGSVAAGADRVANTVISTTIGYNRSITDTLYDLYFLYYNYGSVATHWGIYHSATDAKHYFQGKLMTGTGADLGYQFRVSGSSGFTGNMGITGSASNSLRVKGSGATSATNALLIENSSGTALLTVNDAGNITGSFTGSFLGTASYATTALTASFASTASFVNPLNQNVTITGSIIISGSNSTLLIGKSTDKYAELDPTNGNYKFRGNNGNYGIDLGWYNTNSNGYISSPYNGISILSPLWIETTPQFITRNADFKWDLYGSATWTIRQYVTYYDLFKINSSGNVLIGTGSINSSYKLDVSGSGNFRNNLTVTGSVVATSFTGSLLGTASYATTALTSSFASTASFVNPLNQNVLITGSLTVGSSSLGSNENTLVLGPPPAGGAGEGGQLLLQASGGTYTTASMIDNYQNTLRFLRGTNASSDAYKMLIDMHSGQIQMSNYNSTSAFTGSVIGLLGFDNNGMLLTTTASSGGGGGGVTINNNTDNYIITATGTANTLNGESNLQFNGSSLTVTGQITSSGAIISTANNTMYFRGGDDAEFWDINVANTVGIYGQQTQGIGAIKLGSGGPTLYGSGSNLGIGTTTPNSGTLHVNGGVFASSFTGSLLGTASYAALALTASNANTASYVITAQTASYIVTAQTASYVLQAVSASFASTASFVNPLNQDIRITGSVTHSGSLFEVASNGGNFRVGKNGIQITRTDGAALYSTLTYSTSTTLDVDTTIRANSGQYGNRSYAYPNVGISLGYYSGKWSAQGGGTGATQVFELSCIDTSNTTNFFLLKNGSTQLLVMSSSGDLLVGTGNTNGAYKLDVSGSGNFRNNLTVTGSLLVSGSSVVTGSFTVFTGSAIEFQVLPTGVKIGNIITDVHTVTGSLNVSGSINTIAAITASTALISGSGVSRLTVIGSGSSSPIFTVQGSQGELFSITDSLSGSLFSVNDISGLPILEVFSDNTTLIGDYQAPALYTTKKISGSSGINLIYSLNTGSYDGVFMDYTAKSGSNARAGNFAAIWSGSSVNYMDNSTTDFGNTSGLVFGASISGSNMIVTGSASTSGWTIKAIIRSI